LQGKNSGASGGGNLFGDFELLDSATLALENPADKLTISGNTTIGEGAIA